MTTAGMVERERRPVRIDIPAYPATPATARLAAATLAALAGSLAAGAGLVALAVGLTPSLAHFSHFRPFDYGTLTVIGVLGASVAWPAACRLSSRPRSLFFRMAVVVMLMLWLPDLWLLFVSHEPFRAVGFLMAMHLAVALLTYNSLVRLAPARPHAHQVLAEIEELVGSTPSLEERRRQFATRFSLVLALVVSLDFVLGMVAFFAVPTTRPSGLVPKHGSGIYLAHAAVGVVLTFGALGLFTLVARAGRTLRLASWLGLAGIGLAGVGGMFTTSHLFRVLGIMLMLVGSAVAWAGLILPIAERRPDQGGRGRT